MGRKHYCKVTVTAVLLIWSGLVLGDQKQQDFDFAKRLFKDKLYEMAAKQFEQFIVNYPNHGRVQEASRLIGEAYFLNQQYQPAIEHFEKFINNYPDYGKLDELWFKVGEGYFQLKEYRKAGAAFMRIKASFPKSMLVTGSIVKAAHAYFRAKDHEAVITILKKFVSKYSKSDLVPEARYLAARALMATDEQKQALKEFNRLQTRYPRSKYAVKALYEKARILNQMKRYEDAAGTLSLLIKKYPKAETFPRAVVLLGEINFTLKKYQDAINLLSKYQDLYQGAVKEQVLLTLADAFRLAEQHDKAIELYSGLLTVTRDTLRQPAARFGLARSLLATGKQLEAISEVKVLLKGHPGSGQAREAHLLLAGIYEKQGRFADAGDTYLEYLREYSVDKNEYVAIIKKTAAIFQDKVKNLKKQVEVFRLMIKKYPNHPYADQARYALGLCYEQQEDYPAAIRQYASLIATYGEIEIGKLASERKRYIEEFKIASYKDALRELFSLITVLVSKQDDPAALKTLGTIYYHNLKDYSKAAEAYTLFLETKPDSTAAAEALFMLAQSYYRLARKARLEKNETAHADYLEKCKATCQQIVTSYSTSIWSDDVELLLMEDELGKITERNEKALEAMLSRYRGFLEKYKNSDKLDRILLQIGQIYLEKGKAFRLKDLDPAVEFFDRVLDNFPQSPLVPDAHYYKAEALYHAGKYGEAKELLQKIVKQWPHYPLMAHVVYYLGNSLYELKEFKQSIDIYRSLIYNYPASRYLVEVKAKIGYAYAMIDEREKSASLLEEVKDEYDDEGKLLFTLAGNYDKMEETDRAIAVYSEYLRDYTERADQVRFSLAKLYRQNGELKKSEEQLQLLIDEHPQSGLVYEALTMLCEVQFQDNAFQAAAENLEKLLKLEQEEDRQKDIRVRQVLCLYRMDDLSKARYAAEDFRKEYKKDKKTLKKALPRFKKEEADHFLRKKKLERARETYQSVVDEFERSEWADEGLYGVGETYFREKEFTEAQKVFTRYIRKYPRGRQLGDAYLKLASIQFAGKNYLRAAKNYERVLKLKGARPELARNAAFNKILVYEKMEKFDTAIDAARYYLDRFPGAENIDRVRIKEAIFLMAWDKYEDALEKFKGILSRAKDEELKSEVNFWIGECLFSLGRYEDAIEVYLRLVYFGQGKMMWKVTAEYKAGMAYEKLGRIDEARKIYEYMTLHYGIATEWGRAAAKRLKMLKE